MTSELGHPLARKPGPRVAVESAIARCLLLYTITQFRSRHGSTRVRLIVVGHGSQLSILRLVAPSNSLRSAVSVLFYL